MAALPKNIKYSAFFSSHQLLLLASVQIPNVDPSFEDETLKNIFQYYSLDPEEMEVEVYKYAAKLLTEGKVNEAWQVLLTIDVI